MDLDFSVKVIPFGEGYSWGVTLNGDVLNSGPADSPEKAKLEGTETLIGIMEQNGRMLLDEAERLSAELYAGKVLRLVAQDDHSVSYFADTLQPKKLSVAEAIVNAGKPVSAYLDWVRSAFAQEALWSEHWVASRRRDGYTVSIRFVEAE
jgi:hypothetical protein